MTSFQAMLHTLKALPPIRPEFSFQTNQRFFKLSALVSLTITIILFFWSFSDPSGFPSPRKFASSLTTQFTLTTLKEDPSTKEYSIKPIAYIFPQFYPIPENNRLWGENFTEWDNVNKVTKNEFGLETFRPAPEIGYYNGLAYETRKRQGEFINENGFYGLAYHHYWMAGTPVMDHILQAMLLDGEPNTHFMLSWANEPWTSNWDGEDSSKVLLRQDYGGITDWRKHFDWLLPFFRHPNYIRSEGRIQFIVYKSGHIDATAPGVRYAVFAAWRKWAMEEGIGGMDIIETRQPNNPSFSSSDAVNEFQPHASGMNQEFHHLTDRASNIYHRGSMVCWDSTPRHATDGRGSAWPTCHPTSWKAHIVRLVGRIKQDPNPRGVENFLFVNALNEWGEGNVLEPTVQFGNAYGPVMKEALRLGDEKYKWQSQELSEGLQRIEQYNAKINETVSPPDVCVIIRSLPENGFGSQFPLDDMIFSLQAQTNANWRAVVFATDGKSIRPDLLRRMEPRIQEFHLGEAMNKTNATDFLLSNITNTFPTCASAKYMLITDGGSIYVPTAFELAAKGKTDFVAMNVESKWTIRDEKILQGNLCTRLFDPERKLHAPSEPKAHSFSLPATFISLPKYLSTLSTGSLYPPYLNLSLINYPANYTLPTSQQEGGLLIQPLVESKGWTWTSAPEDDGDEGAHEGAYEEGSSYGKRGEGSGSRYKRAGEYWTRSHGGRQVLSNPSFTGCQEAGHIWVDSTNFEETGCYNTPDLGELYGGWKGVDLAFYRKFGRCTKKAG